jgi:hypothetical protein
MPPLEQQLFGSIVDTKEQLESAKKGRSMSASPPSYPAPRRMPLGKAKRESEREETSGVADPSAYLAKLATLARELAAEGQGAANLGKLRMLRQRLREWVEDVRSVGGFDSLADAVNRLALKLDDAIAAADVSTQVAAVATQLANIASNSGVHSSGRREFWK